MPELPEVETIKRELVKAVVGKKISAVRVYNAKLIRQPRANEFESGLAGARIMNILRRAKLLILELSNGKSLVIHLKMTGQLIFRPGAGKGVKKESGSPSGIRVSFLFSDGTRMDFKDQRLFAELRLLDDWRSLKFIKSLGPEPSQISAADFRQMLSRKKTRIKPLLMDQAFIAGIGNLYAAEALFRAGIHPGRSANSLSERGKNKLFQEINRTLNEAIKYKGSSVDQYVQLDGTPGSYIKYHKVYGRQGKPCFKCKGPIKRISLGGRGTYFCPRCQK